MSGVGGGGPVIHVLYMIAQGVWWLWQQIPVLIRRGEYHRLIDNEVLIRSAHSVLSENYKLKAQNDRYRKMLTKYHLDVKA